MGGDYQLLRGCWSSRSYIKVANVTAQNTLEKRLEPLYTLLEKQGFANSYPLDQINYAWRQTLRNHPHDSICGCSRDEVHAHMEDLFARTKEVTDDLQARAMNILSYHNDSPYRNDAANYVISVFNPAQISRSGVVDVQLEFLMQENVKNFRIVDKKGKDVYFEVTKAYRGLKDVVSPVNLPGTFDVDIYVIQLYVEDMQPASVRHYAVIPQMQGEIAACAARTQSVTMENEYYCVTAKDGGVDILIKSNNRLIHNAFRWEESGDRGDSYVYQKTYEPEIYSDQATAAFEDISLSELRRTFRIKNILRVPKDYDFIEAHRNKEYIDCPVTYTVTLEKGTPYLEIGYEVENTACDHRVRFVVDTGLKSDKILTDSAFDTKYHDKSEITPDSHFFGFCNANFAAIENKAMGVAVFSQGLHEVENVDGRMMFTVVRATGAITRMGLKINGGPMWEIPENQELRTLKGKMAFYAYSGDAVDGSVKHICNCFNAGFIVNATSMDSKKYSGGRPAVQDSDIAEIFYLKDKYENVVSESDRSMYSLDNDVIEITAVKHAEDGNGTVVRLFNPSIDSQICTFKMIGSIFASKMSEKKGRKLGENSVKLMLRSKQIYTLRIID